MDPVSFFLLVAVITLLALALSGLGVDSREGSDDPRRVAGATRLAL